MKLIHAGKRLQELQSDLVISSAELSRKTGISPQQMLRYRTQKNMKLHTMQILCEALGIEPAIFISK